MKLVEQITATANKQQLAQVLNCSSPTLDRLINRYSDFPIERKGEKGVDYVFNVNDVKAFLDDECAKEIKERESAIDLLTGLKLDRPGAVQEGDITPAGQLALVRAERERRKLQQEAGLLVDVASLRRDLQPVFTALGQFLRGMPRRMGSRFNLPDSVILAMEDDMADEMARVVEKGTTVMGGDQTLLDEI